MMRDLASGVKMRGKEKPRVCHSISDGEMRKRSHGEDGASIVILASEFRHSTGRCADMLAS